MGAQAHMVSCHSETGLQGPLYSRTALELAAENCASRLGGRKKSKEVSLGTADIKDVTA